MMVMTLAVWRTMGGWREAPNLLLALALLLLLVLVGEAVAPLVAQGVAGAVVSVAGVVGVAGPAGAGLP